MCISAPKVPKTPPAAQLQPMVAPKDMIQNRDDSKLRLRRRGMWASIFTGPQGITGPPIVTGTSGGVTGG